MRWTNRSGKPKHSIRSAGARPGWASTTPHGPALTLHRHHHNPEGEATTLGNLGYIAHHAGHYTRALHYYERSLERLRAVSDTYHAALALDWMGQTHATLGHQQRARQAWSDALRLYQEQHRDTDAARVQQQLVDLDQQDSPPTPVPH